MELREDNTASRSGDFKLYPDLKVNPELPKQPSAPNEYVDIDQNNARTYQNTADQGTIAKGSGLASAAGLGRNFRLQKINEIQAFLESERDKRRALSKKYQRGINVITGFAYGLEAISVGIGVAGITLLTTVVAAPVVVAMEGVAIGAAGISVVGNAICDKILSA